MTNAVDFADWLAIGQLKARYCRLLDTKQWDLWTALFTDDLVLDTSEAGGPAPVTGRAKAMAMVRGTIETARTAHQVHSPEITINGDTAEAIWAMQDRVVFDTGLALTGYGHYFETYVRRDGEWKIARSKLVRVHIDVTSPADQS